ncbi:MAG: hypothetical protein OXF02_02770 [Simkaniaceae bacterium]|nr:hypothetical protein [Simkaniaceae bacterium]
MSCLPCYRKQSIAYSPFVEGQETRVVVPELEEARKIIKAAQDVFGPERQIITLTVVVPDRATALVREAGKITDAGGEGSRPPSGYPASRGSDASPVSVTPLSEGEPKIFFDGVVVAEDFDDERGEFLYDSDMGVVPPCSGRNRTVPTRPICPDGAP